MHDIMLKFVHELLLLTMRIIQEKLYSLCIKI